LSVALAELDELVHFALETGDRSLELRARLVHAWIAYFGGGVEPVEAEALVDEAIAYFSEHGDDAGLADAWALVASREHSASHSKAVSLALERVIEHGERAGSTAVVQEARIWQYAPIAIGPTPVDEALAFFAAAPPPDPIGRSLWGQLHAMRGEFALGREVLVEGREQARETGRLTILGAIEMGEVELELTADDAERALRAGRSGIEHLERAGEQAWLSTLLPYTAEALYRLGRDDEAGELVDQAEKIALEDDVTTLTLVRQVRAKLLARRGEFEPAERLAREAVALLAGTESPSHHADGLTDLGLVLTFAGKREAALEAFGEARSLYEQKGHTVGVARADKLRAELVASLEA